MSDSGFRWQRLGFPSGISMARAWLVLTLLVLAGPLMGPQCGIPDPNKPSVVQPPNNAIVETSSAYIRVRVLDGEVFEVWIRENLQDPAIDFTPLFTFAADYSDTKEEHHANVPVPLGTHEVWVVQYKASEPGQTWQSGKRRFWRATGATIELGALTGTDGGTVGQVVAQALGGVLERTAPENDRVFVFGPTVLNGGPTHPGTVAFSTDTDPTDGLPLSYYDEQGAGTIEAALGLVSGETEVHLTTPFLNGSDVYAYYWRVHSSGPREVGLAKMPGGVAPFERVSFPATSGLFGDDYSLFEDGDLAPAGGGVVYGSTLYLYGLYVPGGATNSEVFLARIALNAVEQKSSYEYWTGPSGGWQLAPVTPASLWDNSGPPSVQWSVNRGRWVALHTLEQGTVDPYGVTDSHSVLALRLATDLEGPWSPPVTVWARPQTLAGGEGSGFDPAILPGIESGSKIYAAANDGGEWTQSTNAYLYEIDLDQLVIPPVLDFPPNPTHDNPHDVTGFAAPGDLVRLFVNGEEQGSDTADPTDGSFTIPAILLDGANAAYAVADVGGQTSDPSNTITLNYENNLSRTPPGPIGIDTDTVWTPGTPNEPYVIDGDLTVDPGVLFVLQPGTELKFDGNYNFVVNGTLRIQGTGSEKVKLTSNEAEPTRGYWNGVDVVAGSANVVIDHAVIEFVKQGIAISGATSAIITNSEVREFTQDGIVVASGGSASVSSTVIDNRPGEMGNGFELTSAGTVAIDACEVYGTQYGFYMYQSSPTVTGSRVEENSEGLHILAQSDPQVSGNTITANTAYGVHVRGHLTQDDPQPVVTANDIFGNGGTWEGRDYSADYFYTGAESVVLDASNNWWGTDEVAEIAVKIGDYSDGPSTQTRPFVSFTPFLDDSIAASGAPVDGNYLNGPVSGPLTADAPYDVVGDLLVPEAETLTIEAGAELRFIPEMRITADGTLLVAGTSAYPVLLTSAEATPASGSWDGLYISGTSVGSIIEYAVIDYAHHGVDIRDTSAVVRDSTIREFGHGGTPSSPYGAGIYLEEPSGGTIRHNTFAHSLGHSFDSHGIFVRESGDTLESVTVTIDGNTIRDATDGIRIEGRGGGEPLTPIITGNLIESNTQYGIYVLLNAEPEISGGNVIQGNGWGIALAGNYGQSPNPAPVVNGNDILNNGSVPNRDLHTSNFGDPENTVIDAEGNWWGVADAAQIADKIHDHSDSQYAAVVDFAPFLDNSVSAGGAPVPGNYLVGPTEPDTVLTTGTVYDVIGELSVPLDETLTVEAGATLEFVPGAALRVRGTLDAAGAQGNRATFQSSEASPTPGSWTGIVVESTSTGTVIDFAEILHAERAVQANGAELTVSDSRILSFSNAGLYLDGVSTATLTDNFIQGENDSGTGIYLQASSATIDGNEIRDTNTGIYMVDAPSPSITANTIDSNLIGIKVKILSSPAITAHNVITTNTWGIRLEGNYVEANNPDVQLAGNEIRDNANYNLWTGAYGNPENTTVDASLNHWGTTVLDDIVEKIFDYSDGQNSPVVEIIPVLDEDMEPVDGGGNYLNGVISSPTTLTTGTTYQVIGDVTVASDITLTVEPGVTLEFLPGLSLTIEGTLNARGTFGNEITFTCTVPTPGSWEGIYITGSGVVSVLEYAVIEYADHGVDVQDTSAVVRDSIIREFGSAGVHLKDATGGTIEDNTFSYSFGFTSASGIVVWQPSEKDSVTVTIHGNTIREARDGIRIEGPGAGEPLTPMITGNTVEDNLRYGIYVQGHTDPEISGGNVIQRNGWGIALVGNYGQSPNPAPVVNGNDILDNGPALNRDLSTSYFGDSGTTVIDAVGNWWGVADAVQIVDKIRDHSDAGDAPIVDFAPFLSDSVLQGGTQVQGDYLVGPIANGTTIPAGTYQVVGEISVLSGETVTVDPGARLEFVPGATFTVYGALNVQGAAGNLATFTSMKSSPERGDWTGIVVEASGNGSVIDHALIEYADQGIAVTEANVTISNCDIVEFATAGIFMDSVLASTIDTNLIDNADQSGTGIHLVDSSPHITRNEIRNTDVGIYLYLASDPEIGGESTDEGNTITSNKKGIFLQGIGEAGINPDPTINRNNIYGNTGCTQGTCNLWIENFFFPGVNQVINARENWWGFTTSGEIAATFHYNYTNPPTPVDYSDFLDDVDGDPILGSYFTSTLTNVNHSVAHFRPAFDEKVTISFDLSVASDVTVSFYPEPEEALANPVRVIQTGWLLAGPQSIDWYGEDDLTATVPDGAYAYRVEANDGAGNIGIYDPPRDFQTVPPNGNIGWGTGSMDFAPHKNQFWKRQLTALSDERRFSLSVTPEGGTKFTAIDGLPLWMGETHLVMWDGRDPSGNIVSGQVAFGLQNGPPGALGQNMRYNHVIVHATAPTPTGTAPNIEVKSDPYLIHHSYEQFSKIAYQLDQDAVVTIKLLPPGVSDPSDPMAIAIVTNELEPAEDQGVPITYTHEWLGYAAGDTNAISVAEEGSYTFTIEATSQATSRTSLYRGVLQVRN